MGLSIVVLIVLVMLIIIIYMVAGLIKPQNSRLAGKDKTRKNVLIHGAALIGGCFVLLVITAIALPSPEKGKAVVNQQSPPQSREPSPTQAKQPTPEEKVAAANKSEAERQANLLERRKDEAWRDCRDYINTVVTRPLTVNVGMFDSQKIVRDKKIVIVIDFTAKNEFDIAQPLSAYCEYWQPDMSRTAARIIDR